MATDIRNKPRLVLHICCAGCGAYVSNLLSSDYELFLLFDNSNICPRTEYERRRDEVIHIAAKYGLSYEIIPYNHYAWLGSVSGLENEPEKGKRCYVCYRSRMESAVLKAVELGAQAFSSTLSVSPHKVFPYIKEIGDQLCSQYGVSFYDQDYKKGGGALEAAKLSNNLGLYRQDYCGCEFSYRTKIAGK